MAAQYALDLDHIDELTEDPTPFSAALDITADHTEFRAQISEAVDYMLGSFGLAHDNHGRAVPDKAAWRQADRAELADRIAIHIVAGIYPQMQQQNEKHFAAALELIKQQRTEKKGQ